jgi:hypothetical protein
MTPATPIASLRRFVPAKAVSKREWCDLCSIGIGSRHRHLFEVASRRLICVCQGCSLLFPREGRTKYTLVPLRVVKLDGFEISDGQWNSLGIPIGLAFFSLRSGSGQIGATYPSPAGTTESELSLDSWNDLAGENSLLRSLEADVEAFLVNRTRNHRDYYIAPIDRCYELAGTVRKHWRGLSGGAEAWEAIDRFFEGLAPVGHA